MKQEQQWKDIKQHQQTNLKRPKNRKKTGDRIATEQGNGRKRKNEGNEGNHKNKDKMTRKETAPSARPWLIHWSGWEVTLYHGKSTFCSTYPTEVIPPKWKEKLGNSEKLVSPTFGEDRLLPGRLIMCLISSIITIYSKKLLLFAAHIILHPVKYPMSSTHGTNPSCSDSRRWTCRAKTAVRSFEATC